VEGQRISGARVELRGGGWMELGGTGIDQRWSSGTWACTTTELRGASGYRGCDQRGWNKNNPTKHMASLVREGGGEESIPLPELVRSLAHGAKRTHGLVSTCQGAVRQANPAFGGGGARLSLNKLITSRDAVEF
jgi:hypothetical protein